MNKEEELELFGQRLLNRGFADWFRVMFEIIEQRPFIIEPIHPELFETFENIYQQKILRSNINLPPRSAKTTLSRYFLSYGLTKNPRCNFIYTSYSQSLLNTIASEVRDILEHPLYKAMYPNRVNFEEEEMKPQDNFWAEYLLKTTGHNTYSSKKITTYMNGNCLFASVGAQITGMGCGIRTAKDFSGALILDDANKPADIRSEVMREKVLRYYEETLLSRLNNPYVPIVNIQQRLHVEDLSGLLEAKYNFETLRKPLLDDNGVCQIPTQYTEERIKELQTNNYMFSAQYQQQPIILGGQVIKRDWFRYYNPDVEYKYKRILITADTAMKVKEHNDYSVFVAGGVTEDNKLHILNVVRGKWEAPDLKRKAKEIFEQYRWIERLSLSCSGLYIEDKASGIGLIQELQREGIPVVGLEVDKDILTRVESVLSYIESGQVLLPYDENYSFNRDLLNECEAFSRDDSHLHDDQCLIGNTKIATLFGDKFIKDIKIGDYVLTPYGFNKVLKSACTGEKVVIKRKGIVGTKEHKVFINGKFDKLYNLKYDVNIDTLTYEGLLKWKYKKLLSSMVLNINLWGRKDIIYLNQIQIKDEKILKDFMLQFGNFIQEKKYQKAILFIIKMVIVLITTMIIWNVYQNMNICKNIKNKCGNLIKDLNRLNIWKKSEDLLKNGINLKKAENGIKNMLKCSWIKKDILKNVLNAEKNSKLVEKVKYVKDAKTDYIKESYERKEKVYNITVDKAQVYYANNILVSNCDALTYIIQEGLAKREVSLLDFFAD